MSKNNNIAYYLIAFLAVFFLLTGCLDQVLPGIFKEEEKPQAGLPGEQAGEGLEQKKEIPDGMLPLRVYFPESKGNYLVPVTILIPWTEGVARAALERIIEGPTPAQEMRFGLTPVLPPTTKVYGITIKEGTAIVDLNNSFLDYDPGEERSVLGSVIFSLLQFPTVDKVEIFVEGSKQEKFPGGTYGEEAFSQEFGLNLEVAEEVVDFQDTTPVILYFCTLLGEEKIFYIPVTRVVAGKHEIIDVTIKELLNGPKQGSGLFSEIPIGTQLKGFSLEEGILEVNFSQEILNYKGGLTGEENLLQQLVLTLTAIPGVDKVQVLVEGEPIILTYGTSFQDSLPPPLLINPVM
ncbi:MAG: GerMN domain-containing protein [Dethiobacteria bacterium]|jgi:germination protein M